jgi:hypothetical protein
LQSLVDRYGIQKLADSFLRIIQKD